jgi:hypothetical protein
MAQNFVYDAFGEFLFNFFCHIWKFLNYLLENPKYFLKKGQKFVRVRLGAS